MKQILIYFALTIFVLISCNSKTEKTNNSMATTTNESFTFFGGLKN